MTKRERFLAIGVATVVGLFGLQFAFTKVTGTLQEKHDAIAAARGKLSDMKKTQTSGLLAARKIESLVAKSLPSDPEAMKAQYRDWLFELGEKVEMKAIKTTLPTSRQINTSAYNSYKFTLEGLCKLDRILDLMAEFLDKDYLHSINNLKMTRTTQDPNVFKVKLDAHVLALHRAPAQQAPSQESSGRLAMSAAEYKEVILGRNPFSPPNKPPKISTRATHTIHRGKNWTLDLEANDAEKHAVRFEVLSDDLPDGIEYENGSFSGTPKENGEEEVIVRAFDDGWPSQSTEQKLVFKIVDPPVEEPEEEPVKFDVATQTFLSALLSGQQGPEATIRSRTDGKAVNLSSGSDFEIGTIKAKVVSINVGGGYMELESDGMRWTIDMDTSLADAYKQGKVD